MGSAVQSSAYFCHVYNPNRMAMHEKLTNGFNKAVAYFHVASTTGFFSVGTYNLHTQYMETNQKMDTQTDRKRERI